ncbi:hypothetical protein V7I44_21885, partial [Citrobacter farmeri]|uniref:hypothetical protein n=1 Tax=Citrobacter farmeri TaxID=67824 RepID=UPI002FF40AC5
MRSSSWYLPWETTGILVHFLFAAFHEPAKARRDYFRNLNMCEECPGSILLQANTFCGDSF